MEPITHFEIFNYQFGNSELLMICISAVLIITLYEKTRKEQ